MTTPETAKDIFERVQAAYPLIVGAPNDDDVKRLTEALSTHCSRSTSPAALATSQTSY